MSDRKDGFRKVASFDNFAMHKAGHDLFNETVNLLGDLGFKLCSWTGSVPEMSVFVNAQTGAQVRILYDNQAPETSSVTVSEKGRIFPRRYKIGNFIVKAATQRAEQRVSALIADVKAKRRSPPAL